MKRPPLTPRPSDDKTLAKETGLSRAEWFKSIEKSGDTGRAAIGKFLLAKKVDPWWIGTLTVEFEAHAGIVEKDGRARGYSICSTKTLGVPPARAYAAFTSSADLNRWFGPQSSFATIEGGSYGNGDGNRGTVKKIRPDKALVFTWDSPGFAEGSVVEVLFQPKGDKCGLVVNHTRIMSRGDADAVRAMWEGGLGALKVSLEK